MSKKIKLTIITISFLFILSPFIIKKLPKVHIISAETNTKIDLTDDIANSDGIPLFLQTDKRWGDYVYGDDCISITGCGPTCLSMVRCGLGKDGKWNPYEVAKAAEAGGYYRTGRGSSWDLMREGASLIGLQYHDVIFDEEHIIKELKAGNPIICSMRPGDFTTTGHYIVLKDVTNDGKILVNDPNSIERSFQYWETDRLMGQIKNLWGYELAE